MTPEKMRQKLALTPAQKKAFEEFERAHKKCKKAGIRFHTVLETMTALNGKHLETVFCNDDFAFIREKDGNRTIQMDELCNPTIYDNGFAGFADDTHYAILKI